jgi:hypothetical protein
VEKSRKKRVRKKNVIFEKRFTSESAASGRVFWPPEHRAILVEFKD